MEVFNEQPDRRGGVNGLWPGDGITNRWNWKSGDGIRNRWNWKSNYFACLEVSWFDSYHSFFSLNKDFNNLIIENEKLDGVHS